MLGGQHKLLVGAKFLFSLRYLFNTNVSGHNKISEQKNLGALPLHASMATGLAQSKTYI